MVEIKKTPQKILNALTIDVEDYFQVHAFSNVIKYEDWGNYECRIERNTDRILEILGDSIRSPQSPICNPQKATFFVLGWIAERYPDLVRRIQKEGHEIACHGYAHQLIYAQSGEKFRQDIKRSKGLLEDITGNEVIGYRAPSYSVTNRSRWALEILVEEGFKYDSSIFPVRHDFYGMPDAPRFPFTISTNGNSHLEFSMLHCESILRTPHSILNVFTPHSAFRIPHSIIEFPISTVRLLGMNLPISGGGYFRLLPYSFVKRGLRTINEKEKKPFIFYVHPWEFDAAQPRISNAATRSRFRHYVNLDKTENRFKKLLNDFWFSSVQEVIRLHTFA